MARSMPSPWLFNALSDIFREDSEVAHANMQNKKWPPKMVQVVSCNLKLGSLVVSDKEHMITVFLTNKCLEEVLEQHSLPSLKYSQVKIANFHFSTVLQSAGHHDLALLHSQKVIFPLAIQCAKLTYMGGNDIELIGEPVDVNKDPRVQRILGSLKYHDMVKKLVSRQYNFAADVVGRLPIHDGCQLLLERYSEENPPQLRHADAPAELLAKLEERRTAVRSAPGTAVGPTTAAPAASSASSSFAAANNISSSASTIAATTAVVAVAAEAVEGADSFSDSQQLLYGDSQDKNNAEEEQQENDGEEGEDVVFIGEQDSHPLRDSQMMVEASEASAATSSGGGGSEAVTPSRLPRSSAPRVTHQSEEAAKVTALYERLMSPSSTAAAAAGAGAVSSSQGNSSASSSQSSHSSSSVATLGSTDPASLSRRRQVGDLTQADSSEMHHFLLGRYQQSSQMTPSSMLQLSASLTPFTQVAATPTTAAAAASSSSSSSSSGSSARPITNASAASAPLSMLPPTSSASLPLYVKSPAKKGSTQTSEAATTAVAAASDAIGKSLVGRKTLQKVGKHVFRGVITGEKESKYVVQYEGDDNDTDELSEEEILRILVPEESPTAADAPGPTQSQTVANPEVTENLEEIATQPQYPVTSSFSGAAIGGAVIVGVPMEDDEFINMLRVLDKQGSGSGSSSGADSTQAASNKSGAAAEEGVVMSESKKMLEDLQAFIVRVNKRKEATTGTTTSITTTNSTADTAMPVTETPSKKQRTESQGGRNSSSVGPVSRNSGGVSSNSGGGRQGLHDFVQFLLKHGLRV